MINTEWNTDDIKEWAKEFIYTAFMLMVFAGAISLGALIPLKLFHVI